MDDLISVEDRVAFEVANHERHVREQKILVARYHPRHTPEFVDAMAVRQLVHERRVAEIQGKRPRRRRRLLGIFQPRGAGIFR